METPARGALRWVRSAALPARTVLSVRTVLVLLGALGLLLLGTGSASAHDQLVSTSPKDGGTVATTPTKVVLTFSDKVISVGTELVVTGPDGPVQQGRPSLDGHTVTQPLVPGSPAGRYTVTWRATSKDGHPVSGTFTFTSSAAGQTSPSGTTSPTDPSATSTTTQTAPATSPASGTAAAATSATSTGDPQESGTSWALWLVLGVLVLAGAGAATVRIRRGHGDRG